jgi:hypothetical protein
MGRPGLLENPSGAPNAIAFQGIFVVVRARYYPPDGWGTIISEAAAIDCLFCGR